MSKEDKTYYIGFLGSFSDSDLLALFRFIRKMTDTPDVVQSEAIDFFGELEDICHFLVWSRFTDIVTSGIYPPCQLISLQVIVPYIAFEGVRDSPVFFPGSLLPCRTELWPLTLVAAIVTASTLDPCLIRSKVLSISDFFTQFTQFAFRWFTRLSPGIVLPRTSLHVTNPNKPFKINGF